MTPKIRRILCPVDFSEASARAVEQAIAMARWYKARITALHVYGPLFAPIPGLPPPAERVSESELQRVRNQTTESFRAAAAAEVPVDVAVEIGHPTAAILDCSVRLAADLIVMGTHGAGGFEHLLLGSVAEKVLRRAACPVLTVPRAAVSAVVPCKHVLCAVDFSETSLSALQYACSIAEDSEATLTILHVLEWPWQEPPPPVFEELPAAQAAALVEFRRYIEKSAMDRLKALVPEASQRRCTLRPTLRHGKPYVEILRLAEKERADLIVVGIHGRHAAELTLFGSTTNHVVRRATCPVLTLKQ